MATPKSVTPDVSVAGMKAGDQPVDVAPKQGGGYTLSPLPVGGRRRKSKKAGRRSRRRGGAEEMEEAGEMEPAMGARRRKSKKSKKAGRRTRRR